MSAPSSSVRSTASKSPQTISITTGTILRTIAVLAVVGMVWLIKDVVLMVLVSVLLAGVMYPFVRRLSVYRIPRGVSVCLFYLFLFGFLGLGFMLLIPALVHELGALNGDPRQNELWLSGLSDGLRGVLAHVPFLPTVQISASGLQDSLIQTLQGLFQYLGSFVGGLVTLTIVFALSYYIIVEEETLREAFRRWVPARRQEQAVDVLWRVINRLGDWLRGQLILSLILALLYFAAFSLMGKPYPILLALFAGLLQFIPYLGPMISAVPALLLAATVSPLMFVLVLITLIILQQVHNNIIAPKVMQRAAGLNPIVGIVSVMIGAQLFGLTGALFSIPIATTITVLLNEFVL